MTDKRPSADGGETTAPVDVERAGQTPPDPPTADGLDRILPDLLEGADSVATAHLVRAALEQGSGRPVGESLVEAIEDQVTVVGTTIEAGFDPSNPELDVLIETEHDHGVVASSLSRVGPVDGVVVADVSGAAASELEDDPEPSQEEVDGASANDVFNELKEEVGQEGYGEVVDELEDVSFPGGPDPEEEVDLEAETGLDLEEEPEPIDLEGGEPEEGDIELEGDDEITTKELLGEADSEGAEEVKAPDEQAIADAIAEVDLVDQGKADPGVAGPSVSDMSADASTGESSADAGADPTTSGGVDDAPGNEPEPAEGSATPTDADAEPEEPAPSPEGTDTGAGAPSAGAESGRDRPTADADAGSSGPTPEADQGAAEPTPEADPATDDSTAAAEDGPAAPAAQDMDAFVSQFVAALESGEIDGERRTELREALGIESNHSLDVRMEYVQKRVDNLAAYTDAWESFLSEEGSGRAFMESVGEDIEAIEDRLDAVEAGGGGDIEGVERELDSIRTRLEEIDDRHDEDVTRLDTRMDSVESKLEGRVEQVEDAVTAMKEKVRTLLEWREHINDVIGD